MRPNDRVDQCHCMELPHMLKAAAARGPHTGAAVITTLLTPLSSLPAPPPHHDGLAIPAHYTCHHPRHAKTEPRCTASDPSGQSSARVTVSLPPCPTAFCLEQAVRCHELSPGSHSSVLCGLCCVAQCSCCYLHITRTGMERFIFGSAYDHIQGSVNQGMHVVPSNRWRCMRMHACMQRKTKSHSRGTRSFGHRNGSSGCTAATGRRQTTVQQKLTNAKT